jgi:hypothetical protein
MTQKNEQTSLYYSIGIRSTRSGERHTRATATILPANPCQGGVSRASPAPCGSMWRGYAAPGAKWVSFWRHSRQKHTHSPVPEQSSGRCSRPGGIPQDYAARTAGIADFHARWFAGKIKLKLLPFPGWLCTQIRPPINSINGLTSESPRPVPPASILSGFSVR